MWDELPNMAIHIYCKISVTCGCQITKTFWQRDYLLNNETRYVRCNKVRYLCPLSPEVLGNPEMVWPRPGQWTAEPAGEPVLLGQRWSAVQLSSAQWDPGSLGSLWSWQESLPETGNISEEGCVLVSNELSFGYCPDFPCWEAHFTIDFINLCAYFVLCF